MHIHILGICGTFMGGIAVLARALGHKVTGSDKNVYPPMSTQLESLGIELTIGYQPEQLDPAPDMVVIGNAMSRGNAAVEAVLNKNLPYTSGPQWLLEHLLKDKRVLAVSGTHGKTTTSSMLAWILEFAGMKPGFLIGGIPENFGVSARDGDSEFFVMEADEYDTAFFDKRSKFVHYRPETLIINNLEFDHADIFDDLPAIQKQFHHLVRMVPGDGLILKPNNEQSIEDTLKMGCWTPQECIGKDWQYQLLADDGSEFKVIYHQQEVAQVNWSLIGLHNVHNGLMAIAAAHNVGVSPERAAKALGKFKNVKRRMELRGEVNNIRVYDDFAHHPTAIQTTINGLRNQVRQSKITAILEPRSNTMKMGIHTSSLIASLQEADEIAILQPENLNWSLQDYAQQSGKPMTIFNDLDDMVQHISQGAAPGDHLLVMSNGSFGGIHQKLLQQLSGN